MKKKTVAKMHGGNVHFRQHFRHAFSPQFFVVNLLIFFVLFSHLFCFGFILPTKLYYDQPASGVYDSTIYPIKAMEILGQHDWVTSMYNVPRNVR